MGYAILWWRGGGLLHYVVEGWLFTPLCGGGVVGYTHSVAEGWLFTPFSGGWGGELLPFGGGGVLGYSHSVVEGCWVTPIPSCRVVLT